MGKILEVKNLHVHYGMIHAIKGISFHVNKGEIVTLIGANGAGKTSTLQTVTGLIPSSSGEIIYNEKHIEKVPGHKLVERGLAHVPEGRRVFASLSVYQNLMLGAYTRKDKKEIEDSLEMIYHHFPRLKERRNQVAGTLSGGEQQMLAMGRALMSKPEMILLDEPSMGLSPIYVNEIFSLIQMIHDSGVTVLLVEQNANKALMIADRAYVLETGSIALEGNAKELLEDPKVKTASFSEKKSVKMNRLHTLGVITGKDIPDRRKLDQLFEDLTILFKKEQTTKEDVVRSMRAYLPNFAHIETGKSLDEKM